MLSGKIEAGSLHFDQVEAIASKGNFKTMIEPWKELPGWANEVWVVRADWLRKPENEKALVDFLKANLMAYRKANSDFDWYLERFRKYVTLPNADKMTAETLRPIWQKLKDEVKAWPADGGSFGVKQFQDLLPAYKGADAIRGTVKLDEVVVPKYLQQALKELG